MIVHLAALHPMKVGKDAYLPNPFQVPLLQSSSIYECMPLESAQQNSYRIECVTIAHNY